MRSHETWNEVPVLQAALRADEIVYVRILHVEREFHLDFPFLAYNLATSCLQLSTLCFVH